MLCGSECALDVEFLPGGTPRRCRELIAPLLFSCDGAPLGDWQGLGAGAIRSHAVRFRLNCLRLLARY